MDEFMEEELNSKGYKIDICIKADVYKVTYQKEKFILKVGKSLNIKSEQKVLDELKVDNITEMKESWETNSYIFIILKYIDGIDLSSYLDDHENIEEKFIANVIRKTILILIDLQKNKVHYCDLKLENIMIVGDVIKLIDFDIISSFEYTSSDAGTDRYSSPEKTTRGFHNVEKNNSWSLGVIMYMLFTGVYPFYADDEEIVDSSRLKGSYDEIHRKCSEEFKDLLFKLFEIDSKKRLGYEEILKHSFLK